MTLDQITQFFTDAARILLSPASFKHEDFQISGPAVLVLPATIAIIGISVLSFIWLFRDATKRGKNGFLAVLFIVITGWPFSFIWWLWLRPTDNKTNQ